MSDWPFDAPYGEHFTAIGTTGCGKTFMVKNAILPRHKRFIIADSKARLDGTSIDFTEPCFVQATVEQAIQIAAGDKTFRLRVPIALGDAGFEQVETLSEGLMKRNAHDVLLYLDEITDLSDAWTVGPGLEGLVRKGRGYRISLGVGSQKPKGVNGWFIDNSAHFYLFGMKRSDVVRFSKNTGSDWIEAIQASIPYGSFKFAHEGFDGIIDIFKPVPKFDWEKLSRGVRGKTR